MINICPGHTTLIYTSYQRTSYVLRYSKEPDGHCVPSKYVVSTPSVRGMKLCLQHANCCQLICYSGETIKIKTPQKPSL